MSQQKSDISSSTTEKIVRRINQARSQVKWIEGVTIFATIFTCLLAFLFISILFDQWIFENGSPFLFRAIFASTFLVFCAIFVVLRVIPLFRWSVNPAFAAEILEKCHPATKNQLLNWVLLKQEGKNHGKTRFQQQILDAMGQNAISHLTQVRSEMVVDRRAAIRWGTAFTVLLLLFFLYLVFSPKNLFDSAIRAINPMTTLQTPQSLIVKEVTPGDVTVFQGETIQVVAKFDRPVSVPVHLVYTTNDGRLVDQQVPMSPRGEGGYYFECRFPSGKKGFEENLVYRIEAGSNRSISRSGSWNVTVRPAIDIQTESLEYEFPKYTNLPSQRIENIGNIRALEGTNVTLHAVSNTKMARAELLFDGKQEKILPLSIEKETGKTGFVSFSLQWDAQNPEKQPFHFYILRCWDDEKNGSTNPIQYTIEIIRDLPPLIKWLNPDAIPQELPLNSELKFQVEVEDPDFGLDSISLRVRKIEAAQNNAAPEKRPFPVVELLKNLQTDNTTVSGSIKPLQLGLKPGDQLEFDVTATDVKSPNPNKTVTETKTLKILPPVENPDNPNQDQKQDQNQQKDKKQDSDQNQNQDQEQQQKGSGEGSPEKKQSDEKQGDQQNDQQKSQQQQSSDQGGSEENQSEKQPSGDNGNNDSQNSGENSENGEKQGENQQNSSENGQPDQEQSENGQSGTEKNQGQPNQQQNQQTPDQKTAPKREKPIDGTSNPGEVFQETLEHMKEKGMLDPQGEKQGENEGQTSDKKAENTENLEADNGPGNGQKTDSGKAPKERPKHQGDDSGTGKTDAYDAKYGDDPNLKNFDPEKNGKPIYQNPNDSGKPTPADEDSAGGKEKDKNDPNLTSPSGQNQGNPEQPDKGNDQNQDKNSGNNDNSSGTDSANSLDQSPKEKSSETPENQQNSNDQSALGSGMPPNSSRQNQTEQHLDATASDPNLQYTEKATSLAIEYLENELRNSKTDQQLLDKLGWNKDDLTRFVARWKEMQADAANAPQNSKESFEWKETLKNIGRLEPKTTVGNRKTEGREAFTATESQRYTPPTKWKSRAEGYTQGLGK